jgi:hypothetical protein
MKTDFWALEANKSKRRNGYQGNTDQVDASSSSVLLGCGVSCWCELLVCTIVWLDPSMW